ncbi:MAG TPA: hypothetical protein PK082_01880 [Phycisphaerae bacterium]|nr:hypothetical protein [Phycisphaerae bacterium]
MKRRQSLWIGIFVVGLLISVAWSYSRYCRLRAAAAAGQADLRDCAQMASRIEKLSRRPTLASDHEKLATETTRLIEEAAKSAGISGDRLIRISPESPARLGETPYKEKPTGVLLKNVTLKQIVEFVHALLSGEHGLNAKSIRIAAPREQDTGEEWTAEIVLTYLVYDPAKPK